MKTLTVILMLIGSVLIDSHEVQAQSRRVEKIKTDSADLNKMVLAVIASAEGSTERNFTYDNIQKRFPQFIRLINRKDASNSSLMEALNLVNGNYKYQAEVQALDDKIIAGAFRVKKIYLDQGYDDAQANTLVLESYLKKVCLQSRTVGKEIIKCTTNYFKQYLEDTNTFTGYEINNLVTQVQKIMEQQYYKKPNVNLPIKKAGDKRK